MEKHLRYTTLSSDTADILGLRLIVSCVFDDIARACGFDVAAYRAHVRRTCADWIDSAELDVTGDTDMQTEDIRTSLMQAVASILD